MILMCKHCPTMRVIPPYRSNAKSTFVCPKCREAIAGKIYHFNLRKLTKDGEVPITLADIFGTNQAEG